MTFDDVRQIVAVLPAATEATSYGTPAFRVGKRLMCREREEGGILAVRVSPEVKEALMTSSPEVYFQTPHYEGYPWVLLRLPIIEEEELRGVLEDAWWESATPTIRKRHSQMRRVDGA